MRRVSRYFLAAGIAATPIWRTVVIAKPADVLFALAIAAWLLSIFGSGRPVRAPRPVRRCLGWGAATFALVVFATLRSSASADIPLSLRSAGLAARFAMSLVIFLMTYDLLAGKPKAMGWTVAAFSTPVLYLPLLAVPGIADGLWDPNGSGRFVGLGDDQPNSMARLFQTTALLAFALAVSGRPGFLRRVFWGTVSLAACLMLVETQSRGCEIGTLLPLVYYALAPPRGALRRSAGRGGSRARIAGAAVLGAAVLAVALSTTLQATLYERWLPPAVRKLGIQTSLYDLVLLNTQIGSRAVDMRYYLPVAEQHPWGVGLGLEDKYLAPVWPEGDGPNSALDLPLYGGIGAVLTFLILVATTARYLWRICGRPPRGGRPSATLRRPRSPLRAV